MTQQAKARLKWLVPISIGGSMHRGRQFTVPVKFDHQGDDWVNNAWSLVVERDIRSDALSVQEVQVHFLMPTAPVEWLASGRKFTLHEGWVPIAEGEIL